MAADRLPPRDDAAERYVLGSMMLSRDAVDVGLQLGDRDFFEPRHGLIFGILAELYAQGRPIDPQTVLAALREAGQLAKVGGPYLHELTADVPMPAHVGAYAATVRDCSRRRQVIEVATRAAQRAHEGAGAAEDLVDQVAGEFLRVRDAGMADEVPVVDTLDEFLEREITYDWLVPGLLERGDRMILTGAEGLGKSSILRQVAVAVAAGLHPFTLRPIDPCQVLVVDCENGRGISHRNYAPLASAAARATGRGTGSRLNLDLKPEGLDLTRHDDARWLLRRVERYRPDLIVIGPVYRLHAGDPNDERTARQVAAVLDRCRAVSGAALLSEAHSPHESGLGGRRSLRPIGSSLWRRWPEFGFGIQFAEEEGAEELRHVDFLPWRGPRDERDWPRQLISAAAGGTGWAWKPYDRYAHLGAA